MARKKKQGQASGGFVPASLETAHSSYSRSDSEQMGPNHGGVAYAQYSRDSADYSNRKKSGMRTGGKVAITIILIALVGVVAGLGVYIYKESEKQSINQDLHGMSREVMQAIDNELTGMTTFDEPFTVLLLGSDERIGEGEEDIGARTDTIVLCRVDPTQNKISMVSIPRDTMVELNGIGRTKINAAYTDGGPAGTIAAVKDLCGVEIDHFAQINFSGLMSLIDAIGGIDVYVEETIDDPDAGDIVIPAGEQHLDGAQTLVFSRSRAYADGDFTRVSNQRKVIEAIVHRGLEAPASELYGIIQASTEFLTTDSAMDVDFIYSLADQIRHNNDYPVQLYSATIPATTDMIDEVSYVIADKAGVKEMMDVFISGGDVGAMGAPAEGAPEPNAVDGGAIGSAGSGGVANGNAGTAGAANGNAGGTGNAGQTGGAASPVVGSANAA